MESAQYGQISVWPAVVSIHPGGGGHLATPPPGLGENVVPQGGGGDGQGSGGYQSLPVTFVHGHNLHKVSGYGYASCTYH